MNRTRGPTSSCNADLRYAAAKSGFFRSRRMMASSCEMLALRFMGFRSIFVIFKILQRPLECPRTVFARRYRREAIRIPPDDHRVIDTVDRSPIDPYLEYTLEMCLGNCGQKRKMAQREHALPNFSPPRNCSAYPRSGVLLGVAAVGQGRFDLSEDSRIVDGGGRSVHVPVGDLLHGATQDFAGARFGKALHDDGCLE